MRRPGSRCDGCDAVGGLAGRGPASRAIPVLRDRYLFGDTCSGLVWFVPADAGPGAEMRREGVRVRGQTAYLLDRGGRPRISSLDGTLVRILRRRSSSARAGGWRGVAPAVLPTGSPAPRSDTLRRVPGPRHPTRRRVAAVAAAALLIAAVAGLDASLALRLAPAVVLVVLALAGWIPGEALLVRAMRRRRGRHPYRRAAVLPVRRDRTRPAPRGRLGASSVALRGPPAPLHA